MVAGYGTGQIRLYEAVTGILHAEVNAHARWIYSLDIAPFSGLVSCIIKIDEKRFVVFTHSSLCWYLSFDLANSYEYLATDIFSNQRQQFVEYLCFLFCFGVFFSSETCSGGSQWTVLANLTPLYCLACVL